MKNNPPRYTFPKKERIYLKREIEELFTPGKSKAMTDFPLRVVYHFADDRKPGEPMAKLLVSVAKKRLHRAVDRVRAKRQIREAYRMNKPAVGRPVNIAVIWMATNPVSSDVIHKKLQCLMRRITEKSQADVHKIPEAQQ